MGYKRTFAQLSGATLGFIHANTGGALVGYHQAGRLYDQFNTDSTLYERPKKFIRLSQKETNMSDGVSNTASISKVFSGNPRVRRVTRNSILAKDQYSLELGWNSNIQRLTQVCCLGTGSQYVSTTDASIINRSEGTFNPWFNLNPTQGIAAGTFIPADQTPATDWIAATHATVYFDIVNMTTLPCSVKIHWFKSKMDTDASIMEDYYSSMKDNGLYTTQFTYSTVTGGGYPTDGGDENEDNYSDGTGAVYPFINTTAYTNLLSRTDVKTKWEKKKSQTLFLGAGSTHRNTSIIRLNCFQSKSKLTGVDSLRFPRGCMVAVFEMQGLASHVTRAEVASPFSAAVEGPTIAPGKIGITVTRKVQLRTMKATNERFDLTYQGRGYTITGVGVANANFIGKTDEAPETGEMIT